MMMERTATMKLTEGTIAAILTEETTAAVIARGKVNEYKVDTFVCVRAVVRCVY
jgi:hypothetical protein